MKRLRFKCPLCGYGTRVFIIAFTAACILAFVTLDVTAPHVEFHDVIIQIILIAAVIMFIAHFWLYRTKRKERTLIKNAEKIYWRELTASEENQAKLAAAPDYLNFIVAAIIIACSFLGYAFTMDFQLATDIIIVAAIAAVLAFTYLLSGVIKHKIWQKIDNTARCAVFPVHHTYTVKNKAKFMNVHNYYHVIYTYEGKLIFKSSALTVFSKPQMPDIKEIRIFEYKNMLTYAEY